MIKKYKKYIYIALSILVCGILVITNIPKKEEVKEVIKVIEEKEKVNKYFIDIKGEVTNPGVYKVDDNYRIIDVIELAGGLTDNADTSVLNLSKKVVDEASIRIYSKKEVSDAIKSIKEGPEVVEVIKYLEKECVCPTENYACISEENDTNLINLNTATKEELLEIPGIGETKALSIIEYRSTKKFESIEDVKNISGIGDATFEKFKNYITV